MLNNLLQFDQQITALINQLLLHNHFFNIFFSFFSLKGGSIVIWIALIIIALLLEERKHPGIQKKDKLFIASFIISLTITGILVNYVIKNIVQRPRPISISCPSDFSFPSGHAAIAFASAAILSHFDKKRKWFYYSVAFLISLSRIYLSCHYFLDIASGAIIGYSISKFLIKLRINIFTKNDGTITTIPKRQTGYRHPITGLEH